MDNALEGEFILNAEKKPKEESSAKATASHNHSHNSSHFYSSFCEYPQGLKFSDQEENEEIILLLRRHFATNIPWLASIIVLGIIPMLFPLIVNNFPLPLPGAGTLFFFTLFYYLILLGFTIINFSLWYFHTGLVTTKRLIDIDLSGILFRQISEARIKNIEEVTYQQVGFVRSLFNYGDVFVQTAGAEVNIEYDRVPKPAKVADIIGDLTVR